MSVLDVNVLDTRLVWGSLDRLHVIRGLKRAMLEAQHCIDIRSRLYYNMYRATACRKVGRWAVLAMGRMFGQRFLAPHIDNPKHSPPQIHHSKEPIQTRIITFKNKARIPGLIVSYQTPSYCRDTWSFALFQLRPLNIEGRIF
jgi:hypothetical protein